MLEGNLYTVSVLESDLKKLGIRPGMTLIVHSSLKSIGGWIAGGPVAVILALENALGPEGTLVMPTQTGDLSDPANWRNPPVPESWWQTIRNEMPAFDPDLTPCRGMGVLPETFRKQNGTMRSTHPQISFAARGVKAREIISNQSLDYGFGEQSPLARIYDTDGWVLLLGVDHDNNTSLHLAEYRATYEGKKAEKKHAPINRDGERCWVEFDEFEFDDSDFVSLGRDFETDTKLVIRGKVGEATALLMPQRALIDYAVSWMEKNRTAAEQPE